LAAIWLRITARARGHGYSNTRYPLNNAAVCKNSFMKTKVIDQIEHKIKSSRLGVFLRSDFNDLGKYSQIGRALARLLKDRKLIRAGHGVYIQPFLANDPDRVAKLLAKKMKGRVNRHLQIGVSLLHIGESISFANAQTRLDLLKLLVARALVENHSMDEIRTKSLENLSRWKSNNVWNSGYRDWENLLLNASDEEIREILYSDVEEPSNRLRQSPPYVGILDEKTIRELRNIEKEMTLLRIKREGQERSRQLVRDGKRKLEDNFLIPREVAKKSKIRFRGL